MKNKLLKGEKIKKEIMEIVTDLKKQRGDDFEARLYHLEKLDGGIGFEVLHMIGRTEDMDLNLNAVNLLFEQIWNTVNDPEDPRLALENIDKYTRAISTFVREIEDAKKDIHESLCKLYDLVKAIHGWETNYREGSHDIQKENGRNRI